MGLVTVYLLVTLSLTTFVICAPFDSKTCIENYLKSRELISSKYGNDDEVNDFCMGIIKSIETDTLAQIKESFEDKDELQNSTDCIIDFLKDANLVDHVLMIHVLNEKNEGISDEKRIEELSATMKLITTLTTDAMIECHFDKELGETFDSIVAGDSSEEEELSNEEDYCMRKHLLDNDLIDKTIYELEENPNGVDASNVDCEVVYKTVEKKIKEQMVDGIKEMEIASESASQIDEKCVVDTIDDLNIIDKIGYVDYISKSNIKIDNLANDKEVFVSVLKEWIKIILNNCLKME